MVHKAEGEKLEDFLNHKVFAGAAGTMISPDPADVSGFDQFLKVYTAGLAIERAAVDCLK